jgi:PTS system N-acetylglucosamine-specific IIC component
MMKKIVAKTGGIFVKLGKSLMLPVAVLPVAGLLLRLGQPDILDIAFMAQAGDAIFSNLPVIFAIGVAIGFAKESHGAAALSAFVGYVVMTEGMKALNPDTNMAVFGGIIMGVTAGGLYNKYKDIALPQYLAFFGGRRFVPIVTGFAAIIYAAVFSLIWPPIQNVISGLGNWIIASGNIGLFSYGVANRLLIPAGLHHILNNLTWFQFGDFTVMEAGAGAVKHGDLARFFAGDPSAGSFMAGFFPMMMFGLPAAALAMTLESFKENRKAAGGVLISAALTSFLTGITEPVEFAFMFLAFPLYVLHSILTGAGMVVMNVLGVKLGFTFSAGFFDYILNYGISTRPLLLWPVGVVYGIVYFLVFRFAIRRWNLMTPGRETGINPNISPEFAASAGKTQRGANYLLALGGKENIKTLEACATRLRVEVLDNAKVDEAQLRAIGAKGVVNKIEGSVQVVIGPEADLISDEIKGAMADIKNPTAESQ